MVAKSTKYFSIQRTKREERTGASNPDACKIVNACMRDIGFASPTPLLDPAKLRRQRKYWRDVSIKEHASSFFGLKCLGFDGRINAGSSIA